MTRSYRLYITYTITYTWVKHKSAQSKLFQLLWIDFWYFGMLRKLHFACIFNMMKFSDKYNYVVCLKCDKNDLKLVCNKMICNELNLHIRDCGKNYLVIKWVLLWKWVNNVVYHNVVKSWISCMLWFIRSLGDHP